MFVSHKMILGSEETSQVLTDLDPETLYDVTVTAIYPDESESEDLIGSQRTCKKHISKWIHMCKLNTQTKMSSSVTKLK